MEQEEQGASLLEYINIIRRRKRLVAITFVVVLVIAIIIAFVWPAKYSSEAVILIEGQDVPQNLVQTTITSYAQQRIEEIKARIMTIGNIMSIVERFELYTVSELERKTRSEIADEFRRSVEIEPMSAEVVDPQSGRPREAVIAFELSFKGRSPTKVQKVASELTDLFLDENLKERTAQTQSTSNFLKSEADRLLDRVEALEAKIAKFKEDNKGGLPEFQSYNLSVVERTEEQLQNLEFQKKELEYARRKLEDEMSLISPTAPVTLPSGVRVLGDADRLKALESEYRQKSSIYREDHPDLVRLKRAIEDLLATGIASNEYEDTQKQLRTERDKLSSLRQRYTDDHPQVVASRRIIEKLEAELSGAIRQEASVTPDNPAYLIMKNQYDATVKDLRGSEILEQQLLDKLDRYKTYVSRGPQLEKELITLGRELSATHSKYNEIRAKLMHAELAQTLESEQKGERFTLIQPPERPSEPFSPNRPGIVFFGVILALGFGIGGALLREMLDGSVYGVRTVGEIAGAPPLVSIGYHESQEEARRHNLKRVLMVFAAIAFIAVFLTLFHLFVKPLDVTWYILMRRLGLN